MSSSILHTSVYLSTWLWVSMYTGECMHHRELLVLVVQSCAEVLMVLLLTLVCISWIPLRVYGQQEYCSDSCCACYT